MKPVPAQQLSARPLLGEYHEYVQAALDPSGKLDRESLASRLVEGGGWTHAGAQTLVELSMGYGTFMLRNALALAGACGREDGELGF